MTRTKLRASPGSTTSCSTSPTSNVRSRSTATSSGSRPSGWTSGAAGEILFPSVRVDAHTIIDLLAAPRTGENADHLCLVVEPVDLDAVKASGRFDVVDGPATRFGARGNGTSLYVKDPDGNTVELRHYGAELRCVLAWT